jgi:translation initiation factor 6
VGIRQADLSGNPYVGVRCAASDDLCIVPHEASRADERALEEALGVQVLRMTVGGTNICGTMVALNSRGAVVGDIVSEDELEELRKRREVLVLEGRLNCAGNLILTNDSHAVVHPRFSKELAERIGATLGVEVIQGDIAGMGIVGSVACATNRGVLVHPKATKEELEAMRAFFKVSVDIGTLNYGSPMIGACCVANSKGAVAGTPSTGIELGRLEDALGLNL